jgi:hypothetical protein
MEYKEDYSNLQENTLILMADGTTRPISTVQIGDLVVDKNENMCMVANILTEMKDGEKINHRGEIEKVRLYTLVLDKR